MGKFVFFSPGPQIYILIVNRLVTMYTLYTIQPRATWVSRILETLITFVARPSIRGRSDAFLSTK